jgi:hypothetical protein
MAFTTTFARFADGRLGELFLINHKTGSFVDTAAKDSAVVAAIPFDSFRSQCSWNARWAGKPAFTCKRFYPPNNTYLWSGLIGSSG